MNWGYMYSCSRGAMSFSSIEIQALFSPQLLMIGPKLQEQIYQQLENIFPHCRRHIWLRMVFHHLFVYLLPHPLIVFLNGNLHWTPKHIKLTMICNILILKSVFPNGGLKICSYSHNICNRYVHFPFPTQCASCSCILI